MNYYRPINKIKCSKYTLAVTRSKSHVVLHGSLHNTPLYTQAIPHLSMVLQQYIPQIFSAMCFNEKNLPFDKELLNTEVSHLLEHILLEFLCEEKLSSGETQASYDGVTRWYKDTPENFEILITNNDVRDMFFQNALKKSLVVFDMLLRG